MHRPFPAAHSRSSRPSASRPSASWPRASWPRASWPRASWFASSRPSAAILLSTALLLGGLTAQQPRRVQVFEAKPQTMEERSVLQGEVLPRAQMRLVPRVTGYVKKIHVREGDRVRYGQLLVTIDGPDLTQDQVVAEALVKSAEAMSAVAMSAVGTAEKAVEVRAADLQKRQADARAAAAARNQAAANYTRIKTLRDGGAATLEEFEAAEMQYLTTQAMSETAGAAIKTAEARVVAAKTEVGLRQAEVSRARAGVAVAAAKAARAALFVGLAALRNPYQKARVTRQIVDAGTLAIADETAVLELMDASRVRIRFGIPRTEASRVKAGTSVKLIRTRNPEVVEATVTRVAGALDGISRTMAAEVELDNRDGGWIPGMLVSVDVLIETSEQALLIPGRALVKSASATHVWVAQGGQAKRVEVKVGFHRLRLVQIVAGLQPGAKVIVAGFIGLAQGESVESVSVDR